LSASPDRAPVIEALTHWNHPDAVFLLAFTLKKMATHHHLQELKKKGFPETFKGSLEDLNSVTHLAKESWNKSDPETLGRLMTSYQNLLNRHQLASKDFSNQVEEISQWQGVWGCKGAGSQGGDCVLLLAEKKNITGIEEKIKKLGWHPIFPRWSSTGLRKAQNTL
jgi:mevalonate kinase